jgi:RNA polymerase sigma-70 factor (ECF subfamily)
MSTVVPTRTANKLEQELEALFLEHYPMLYRTAYGMLKNSADAEDVPQTIFLRLLRNGPPSDFKQHAKRYLYRAAVNLSLDILRSRRRQRLTAAVEGLELPMNEADSESTEETYRRLSNAIAELRPAAVEILMLRYVHRLSEAEIAKLLGVSRGTVAIKLFRTRAQLRKLLRSSSGGEK